MKDKLLHNIKVHGPVKRSKLLVFMQLHFPQLKDRGMRRLIEQLIRDGNLIASSAKGYSIVTNVRELTEAVEYIKAPLRSASIRANTLIGNYNQKYQDAPTNLQFKLF